MGGSRSTGAWIRASLPSREAYCVHVRELGFRWWAPTVLRLLSLLCVGGEGVILPPREQAEVSAPRFLLLVMCFGYRGCTLTRAAQGLCSPGFAGVATKASR